MNNLNYAVRSFINESRQTDARILLIVQWLLILFLLTLTLVSSSIQNFLQKNLDNMLGADIVVTRYQALSDAELAELRRYSNRLSVTQLQTIALSQGELYQSVQLKMVDNHYPLQGTIAVGLSPDAEHLMVNNGPEVGEIWLDSRLYSALEFNMGDKLQIGSVELTLTRIIFHEPDRLLEGHSVAMRAMINQRSFDSPLINDSILYRYLIDDGNLKTIQNWVKNELPDATVIDKATSRHPLSAFWKRAENFTGLTAIILFLMAAIAINLIGRRQLKQESYRQAIYRSMGIPLHQGIRIALTKWFLSFAVSTIPALMIAPLLVWAFVVKFQSTFVGISSHIELSEILTTLLFGLGLLLSLQLPNLWQLKSASIISLIRQQTQAEFIVLRSLCSLGCLSMLAIWYSDNALLTAMMLISLIATVGLLIILTLIVLKTIQWFCRNQTGLFSFSLFMMNQRILSKSSQIIGIGLSVTLLLFTLMLLRDIGQSLEQSRRVNDGNLVIAKASQKQLDSVKQWSHQQQSPIRQLRPYLRAKLVKINQLDMHSYIDHPSDSLATLSKPIRLSWSSKIPSNNRLTQGDWWQPEPDNWQQISVEDEVMTDMQLKIGDQLTFYINQENYTFQIVSSHAYRPGQGSITFWFQIPESARQHLQATTFYMGSMEVNDDAWDALSQIWREHPTIGLTPLKEITQRFDEMLNLVTSMVTIFSSLLLSMVIIVIIASVNGFEQDEKLKNGLLLSFGLRQQDCLKITLIEWLVTAIIASLGAIGGTWLAGELIYQSQFSLSYQPDYGWVIVTLFLVSIVIMLLGLIVSKRSLNTSITNLIRAYE